MYFVICQVSQCSLSAGREAGASEADHREQTGKMTSQCTIVRVMLEAAEPPIN